MLLPSCRALSKITDNDKSAGLHGRPNLGLSLAKLSASVVRVFPPKAFGRRESDQMHKAVQMSLQGVRAHSRQRYAVVMTKLDHCIAMGVAGDQ